MNPEQSAMLATPPSEIVDYYARRPRRSSDSDRVLDVGCGALARNSIFMARQGYAVEGIDNDQAAVDEASQRADRLGVSNCTFDVLDATNLDTLSDDYAAVMTNETLQEFDKPEAYDVLRIMQERTRQGGAHLVSAYMVDMAVGARPRLFRPGELKRFYEATGWVVLYDRDSIKIPQEFNGELRPTSLSSIYARRRLQ